ncbi:hypothetical protein RDI58_026619 [Solanum bulbocastanum]|uniref:RNase H type-1 domain-containing protein n=1 Tax=Solanum bulbocastanum TaxID=147425 RepID=A0AAN8Y3H6_SOLBU
MEVKWETPHLGSYKLNTDASVKQSPGPGGIGGLIRVHLGHRIIGFSEHTPHTNPIRTELLAMRRGLQIDVLDAEAGNHQSDPGVSRTK